MQENISRNEILKQQDHYESYDTLSHKNNKTSLIRSFILRELQTLKVKLNKELKGSTQKIVFFCQLDTDTHPITDSAYQCLDCARFICAKCYFELLEVHLVNCPFCQGVLFQIQ